MIWTALYAIWAVTFVALAGAWGSRRARVAEALNLAAAMIDFVLVCVLLAATPTQGATALQGYLLLDGFGVWVMFCLAIVYLLASVYAIGYMRWMHGEQARLHRFYALFAAFALSMFLAPAQNNPGLYWIAIDLTTIVSAFLVGFQRAPESIADTGAGPSLCASGSQVCIGARPTLVPYPTSTNRKLSSSSTGSALGVIAPKPAQVMSYTGPRTKVPAQ